MAGPLKKKFLRLRSCVMDLAPPLSILETSECKVQINTMEGIQNIKGAIFGDKMDHEGVKWGFETLRGHYGGSVGIRF